MEQDRTSRRSSTAAESPRLIPSPYYIRTPRNAHTSRSSAPTFQKMMYGDPSSSARMNEPYYRYVNSPSPYPMVYTSMPVPTIPNYLQQQQQLLPPPPPPERSFSSTFAAPAGANLPGSYPSTPYNQYSHPQPSGNSSYHKSGTIRKQVPLFHGNLVLECPVPSRLLDQSARKEKEFNQMRYTAVTCQPDDFPASGYTLRPNLMNRQTELFIVMTMYNVSAQRRSWKYFSCMFYL